VKHLILDCLMHTPLFKLKREPGSGEAQLLLGQGCGERGRRQKQVVVVFFVLFCFAEEKNITLISRAIFHQPKTVLNQSDLADQSTLPHLSDYLRRYQTQSSFHGLQKLEE